MDSAVNGNWMQECMDRSLDQDSRQNNVQDPLQKPAMDEERETFVIPQLQNEYDVYGMEYHAGQYRDTCPVRPSPQVRPFMTPLLRDLRGLSVTLATIVVIINRGLFLHSFPTIGSV